MKTGLFLAALVQLAAAQPHRKPYPLEQQVLFDGVQVDKTNKHFPENRHAHLHEKRQDVVVTQVQTVTAAAPDAVVYVNGQGQPISTSYRAEAPQATPVVQTSVVAPAPVSTPHHHHHHDKHHHDKHHHDKHHHDKKPEKHHHKAHAAAAAAVSADESNLNQYGISYSPYNADNSCKTQDEVNSDIQRLSSYQMVRLYGVDCNQVAMVSSATASTGQKLFLGIFDLENIASQLATMHSGLNGDWSSVDTVSIGNELVNSGEASASDVVAAIGSAKAILPGFGYSGPVVTVDTFNAILANPSLCQASDYAAANAHAFFDPDVTAPNTGSWLKSTYQSLESTCGKKVVITESGWPHSGMANGQAVPGFPEQHEAISSIKSAFPSGGVILFSAFDNLWQTISAATFDSEQSWGILSGQ